MARDPNAKVVQAADPNNPALVQVSLNKASLASQAVGPPSGVDPFGNADDGGNFEMSEKGRSFPEIGRKMLNMTPLAQQQVATNDSVLGPYANPYGNGLTTYKALIEQAFQPKWWQDTNHRIRRDAFSAQWIVINYPGYNVEYNWGDFTQEEFNFSLYWGIAIQMYEATLRSDQTPFDSYESGYVSALTLQQRQGLQLFLGQGKCINCHANVEFTKASFRSVVNEKIERMVMGDGGIAVYDNGFYNIGVRPTAEDVGVGGTDPFGKPLSFARFSARAARPRALSGGACADLLSCAQAARGSYR